MYNFDSISSSSLWLDVKPINAGWSNDKKFKVTTKNKQYLLRLSDISLYDQKRKQFELLKKVETLNINVPRPIEFGYLDDRYVYTLLSWIDGEDARENIHRFGQDEQYKMGIEAGQMMKKIHSIPIEHTFNWWDIYEKKVLRKIERIKNSKLKPKHLEVYIDYILNNIELVKERPVMLQHGDFHLGNMLIKDKHIALIDFDKISVADPIDEFKPFVWNVFESPDFERGIIDGYFNHQVGEDFFKILALYAADSVISHVPWAINIGEEEVKTAFKVAESVYEWYDGFKTYIPSWYKK